MKEALFQESGQSSVKCTLCPNECSIQDGKFGTCQVRVNSKGILYTTIYGSISSSSLDPVEKKPLYHFYPGRNIFSIGTFGCNMKCPYCQNWTISQKSMGNSEWWSPEQAAELSGARNSIGIAYTYSEPLIWYEYVMDTAREVHHRGGKNVLVTNGFINSRPLTDILPHIDAMNIDLKTFSDDTYKKIHKGRLKDVQRTIEMSLEAGVHVEVTTLVVTGINDTMDELTGMSRYLLSLDPHIPWHLSRYFPQYNYHEPATDEGFMEQVVTMAREQLKYVYTGNMYMEGGGDSRCHQCGSLLVERTGYSVHVTGLEGDRCSSCGADVPFIVS